MPLNLFKKDNMDINKMLDQFVNTLESKGVVIELTSSVIPKISLQKAGLRQRDIVLEEEQERVAWLQTKCRSGSTASCNAKRAGSTYRGQCEACGLNLPATADVSSAMGLTRRLAAEVVLAGLVYRRRERGKRRQSP